MTSNAPAAMVKAIGMFVWNFNGLDERLNCILGDLLNSADVARGEIVGAALVFQSKCNLIKALVHHIGGAEVAEEYRDLDARLDTVRNVRNDLVHGEQWFDLDGAIGQRRTRLTRKGYSAKHTDYSPEAVLDWAGKVAILEIDVGEYIRDFLNQNGPTETEK
jgi:hypothetical protein